MGNKVKKELIDSMAKSLTYECAKLGSTTTVCVASLPNGFNVGRGESSCVDPSNYYKHVGESIAQENAYNDAVNKLWMLEGYLLKVTGRTSDDF